MQDNRKPKPQLTLIMKQEIFRNPDGIGVSYEQDGFLSLKTPNVRKNIRLLIRGSPTPFRQDFISENESIRFPNNQNAVINIKVANIRDRDEIKEQVVRKTEELLTMISNSDCGSIYFTSQTLLPNLFSTKEQYELISNILRSFKDKLQSELTVYLLAIELWERYVLLESLKPLKEQKQDVELKIFEQFDYKRCKQCEGPMKYHEGHHYIYGITCDICDLHVPNASRFECIKCDVAYCLHCVKFTTLKSCPSLHSSFRSSISPSPKCDVCCIPYGSVSGGVWIDQKCSLSICTICRVQQRQRWMHKKLMIQLTAIQQQFASFRLNFLQDFSPALLS